MPTRFGLIWLSGFRGEDLNVIFYQNMPNLLNGYKSAERIFNFIPPFFYLYLGGHLGWKWESPDTFTKLFEYVLLPKLSHRFKQSTL
jgi:hypothetical protein